MVLANRADSISVLVTGSSTAAVLLALCGSTAIITTSFKEGSSWPSGCLLARRAMQLLAAQTSLEPQPHPVSRTGRGAVREPEHPRVTAADSRASPPRSAPEDPRSPDSP